MGIAVLSLFTVAIGLGCGEPAVDGRWPGEALFTMGGTVRLAPSPEAMGSDAPSGTLRLGVFWAPTKGNALALDDAVEQEVSAAGTFPARFEIRLYSPPADALLHPVADGEGLVARALVLAYLDQDGDRAWDRDVEPLVGGATDRVLVYTPDGLESPLLGTLAPGFHSLRVGDTCAGSGSPDDQADANNVELVVTMAFPASALLDLDCDGKPDEWTAVCPSPPTIRETCREGTVDATMCATCEAYLWPSGADAATCNQWFDKCLYAFAPLDCESERATCLGLQPVDPDPSEPECTSLACICKRVYSDCVTTTDEVSCRADYDRCVSP
jgi:hypothetical protein